MVEKEQQITCELEKAYDRAKALLPDEWLFTGFVNGPSGWTVGCAKVSRDGWHPAIAARAGSLTKALNRLADKLEENAKPT